MSARTRALRDSRFAGLAPRDIRSLAKRRENATFLCHGLARWQGGGRRVSSANEAACE